MIIDIIFVTIGLVGFVVGYRKGVIGIILSGFSVLIGFVLAVQYTGEMSLLLQDFFRINNNVLMPIVAFFFTFFVAMMGIRIAGQFSKSFFKSAGNFNKIAGGLLVGLIGLFLYSGIIWFLMVGEVIKPYSEAERQLLIEAGDLRKVSRTLPYINMFLAQFDHFMISMAEMLAELSEEVKGVWSKSE